MSMDFSNNGLFSTNGAKSINGSERAISGGIRRGDYFNNQASPQRMETKIILAVLSWIGIWSYFGGIFLNLNNWKSDILFGCGLAFIVLKFVRLVIKTYQSYRREEIEQQILEKKLDDE